MSEPATASNGALLEARDVRKSYVLGKRTLEVLRGVSVGLIVGFANQPRTGDPIGIVVSAKAFAPYLGADLVSQLFPVAPPPEISMN